MGIGKLYIPGDPYAVSIRYRLYIESAIGWRGEFIPREHRRFSEGDGYIIELEDGRRGKCSIRKMVNKVIATVPPVFYFYFRGVGRLAEPPE